MKKTKQFVILLTLSAILIGLMAYFPSVASASLPLGITLTPTNTQATETEPTPTATTQVTLTPTTTPEVPPPGNTATPTSPSRRQTEPPGKETTPVPLLPETGELPPTSSGGGSLASILLAALVGIGIGFLIGAGRRGGWARFFVSKR
jgi:hypothetical protein